MVKVALDALCKEFAFRGPKPGTPMGLDFVRGGIMGLGTDGIGFGIAMYAYSPKSSVGCECLVPRDFPDLELSLLRRRALFGELASATLCVFIALRMPDGVRIVGDVGESDDVECAELRDASMFITVLLCACSCVIRLAGFST